MNVQPKYLDTFLLNSCLTSTVNSYSATNYPFLGYVQFTLFLLISDLIRSDQIRSEKISSDQFRSCLYLKIIISFITY